MATSYTDLYSKPLNGNTTVYNATTNKAYSTPDELAADLGIPKTNIDWSKISKTAPTMSTGNPTVTSVGVQANSPTTNITPPSNTIPASKQYTPPNQGTTGVSQGGIIGNLIGQSQQQNPNYTAALNKVNDISSEQSALADEAAKKNNDILSRPTFLTESNGQQGVLAQLLASKQAALAPEYNAAVAELQGANTQSSNQIQAGGAAGNLNSPILGSPGQVQINPSQPGPGSTAAGTNISALIGTRPSPTNPGVTEYYNTQTGQGFSDPQQLANFVNQQVPGANANAANVFQILQQLSPGNNIIGGNTALNPLSQLSTLAQRVLSGQMSYQDALSAGGNVPTFASALQAEIYKQNPSANLSALEGQSTAISGTTQAQQQQIAQWKSLDQQATTLSGALNQLISSNGINPSDINAVNSLIQKVASNTSDPNYASFHNLLTEIASVYTGILGQGGNTDLQRSLALGLLPSDMSGSALMQVVQNLSAAAQSKIAAINTAPSSYSTPSSTGTSGSGSFQEGQTAAGGALIFKNGQWVPNK